MSPKKFEIAGRTGGQASPAPITEVIDHFVNGTEPMTTMTFQLPIRLQRVLKQAALDRQTTVKALLIELIERHLVQAKE
jgi:hypothetical protein